MASLLHLFLEDLPEEDLQNITLDNSSLARLEAGSIVANCSAELHSEAESHIASEVMNILDQRTPLTQRDRYYRCKGTPGMAGRSSHAFADVQIKDTVAEIKTDYIINEDFLSGLLDMDELNLLQLFRNHPQQAVFKSDYLYYSDRFLAKLRDSVAGSVIPVTFRDVRTGQTQSTEGLRQSRKRNRGGSLFPQTRNTAAGKSNPSEIEAKGYQDLSNSRIEESLIVPVPTTLCQSLFVSEAPTPKPVASGSQSRFTQPTEASRQRQRQRVGADAPPPTETAKGNSAEKDKGAVNKEFSSGYGRVHFFKAALHNDIFIRKPVKIRRLKTNDLCICYNNRYMMSE
ncbi:hypothetical protein C8R45DRAFT_930924 [Mycena sanguinolenta]|nr:hypothetical protein C8R45DRAFT_930924 [Mycena sanguinolenta]